MNQRNTPIPPMYPALESERALRSLRSNKARRPTPMLPPPSEPATKFSMPMPSSTDEWYDCEVDVDTLFDSIRVADAMLEEAENAEDEREAEEFGLTYDESEMPESTTQKSRIAVVAARCSAEVES